MDSHEFAIIATGLDPLDQDFEDRFFEAGCDDATIAVQRGAIVVEFDRQHLSLADAISSAMRDVRAAGAEVLRVEPDHLVNLSDIAERSGLTRQAVANYASGKRGEGFPAPAACVTTDHPLYDWVEVAQWLVEQKKLDQADVERAWVIKAFNDELAHGEVEAERKLMVA